MENYKRSYCNQDKSVDDGAGLVITLRKSSGSMERLVRLERDRWSKKPMKLGRHGVRSEESLLTGSGQ
jgi:hypothetical protein